MPFPLIPILAGLATGAATAGGAAAVNKIVNRKKKGDNQGITAQPGQAVTYPGSVNSPAVTSQNLGNEGNALFFNTRTPQQQELLKYLGQYTQGGLEGLKGLQNQSQFDFGPIEEQARLGFAQRTIPSIAERFSGLNAQNSSAFGQTLGQAGSGLESDLAAQRQGYNLQQQKLGLEQQGLQQTLIQNLLGLAQSPQYESLFAPKGPTTGQAFGNAAAQSLPAIIALLGTLAQHKFGQS